MPAQAGRFGKDMLIEIAWLLGSWAISYSLLGWLIGYEQLWVNQLDIQMHNTYFVLPPWAVALPFFAFFATIVTGGRAVAMRFRRRSTWLVLAMLGVLWSLLVGWVVWVIKSLR